MKENLKEKVYQGIYDDVTNGIYKQNDILTESRLIEQYNVSKSPVREALIELCKDGILKNIPRMGYQVMPVTLKEVIDILELRADIETSGLRKAYPIINEKQFKILDQIASKHVLDQDRIVSKNWSRNYEFHSYLYSLNGNVYGHNILMQIIKQSSRYVSQYFQSAWSKKCESDGRNHKDIVTALVNRDIERACQALETDILAVKEEILSLHSWSL